MRSRASLVALVSLGLASACPAPRARSVCPLELVDESLELTPELWLSVMLRNYDETTRMLEGEPLNCAEEPSLDPTRREFGSPCWRPDVPLLPGRPLSDEDLSLSPGPEGTTLVWVAAERYADGSGQGPLAWVERVGARLIVHALGSVRAATKDVRLELHDDWLLVYGKRCVERAGCRAVVQIVARERDAFVTLALHRPGVCSVPAELEVHRKAELELSDGRTREYELARTVHVLPAGTVWIDETLTVSEVAPGSMPAVVRVANAQLPVTRDGDRLVAPASLWAEIQHEDLIELWPERWTPQW